VDIRSDHFELFGLPRRFALDQGELDSAYREMQNRVHPDKFASAGDTEKRLALQWATRANEAYQTLREPAKRAAYLCELSGAELHGSAALPSAFLVQQMEWREALDEAVAAVDHKALEQLEQNRRTARTALLEKIGRLLDDPDQLSNAADAVRELMFLEKFGTDIGDAFERIDA
jgi:molecular chaperone HscB